MRRNTSWMRDLAFHYEAMRGANPNDRLMIVFDIDGTILDIRHMILSVLNAYDRDHGTRFFWNLSCEDIATTESDISTLLRGFGFPSQIRERIVAWCEENFWSTATILGSHRPFHGVLDVIRWFQLQPNTFVGLNSGRFEALRSETLRALNTLGEEYHVKFPDSLLYMNTGLPIAESKVHGIRWFRDQGYLIIAVIDNDQDILNAIAETELSGDMLHLHADIIFDPSPAKGPLGKMSNHLFDLTELITERRMPQHIEFVWHGVDDESTLRQFLVSSVQWAELHVRLDDKGQDLIVRRKRFAEFPATPGEHCPRLEEFLYILGEAGRGVKLDLKDPGLTERVLGLLKASGFTNERIWITINLEEVRRGGLKLIMDEFPKALKQCPVDSLGHMMSASSAEALKFLRMLCSCGIDRFSVNWSTPGSRRIIIQLQNWDFDVNIYNVPDLEGFLQAALLLPKSITAYFNFPKWFYTGISEEGENRYRKVPVRMAI